jgi:hypothetical protein
MSNAVPSATAALYNCRFALNIFTTNDEYHSCPLAGHCNKYI